MYITVEVVKIKDKEKDLKAIRGKKCILPSKEQH